MVLDDIGKMVNRWWFKIPKRFKNTQLDVFQIMPNHLRGIIRIVDNKQSAVEAGFMPARNQRATTRVSPTIGDIVGAFKSLTTDELHSSG
ncbi:hypothetical protein KJ965_04250 [Patescibacteria group bacterium]|nr:hypothetical protein [Patescibacteria group bacterium]